MAKRLQPQVRAQGFSLVEMLVALVFTMILMAGMASVFQSSLSTFYTSGERLSSLRRNRMALDLLSDDLNTAGMYLSDLSIAPTVASSNPPFYILPNQAIAGAGADDPQVADELFFYFDEPLPFEGALDTASGSIASELAVSGTAVAASDSTYTIDCKNSLYAKQVAKGQVFIFKDSWETAFIKDDPTVAGTKVTVVAGPSATSAITGSGPSGLPTKAKHLLQTGVVFLNPAQMVRYSVQILKLDPTNPNGIPCLVRDQGIYAGAFAASRPQEIITENVSGFKLYLSVDSGNNWIGGSDPADGSPKAGYDTWATIQADLDSRLSTKGRLDYQSTQNKDHWFRDIPALVRVDVSTRTATKRSEYSNTPSTSVAYRNQTQSLVMVPRHFGLTMN